MTRKIGAELEFVLINPNGAALESEKGKQLVLEHQKIGGALVSDNLTHQPDYVKRDTPTGESHYGYDATYCTAEGGLAIVDNLKQMEVAISSYVKELTGIISHLGGRIYGGGVQPLSPINQETYRQQVRDRSVYRAVTSVSWRGYKDFPYHYNWGHQWTSLTAQNCPWTEVSLDEVPKAISVAHAFRSIIYLLFASSPILNGTPWGQRDYRPTAWQRFMQTARILEHKSMIGAFPFRPKTLEDVLKVHWEGQPMWFLPTNQAESLKGGVVTFVNPPQEPTFIEFLSSEKEWPAVDLTGKTFQLLPSVEHLASNSDWWSFWTRWRFKFDPNKINLQDFLEAYQSRTLTDYLNGDDRLKLSAIEWRDFSQQPQDAIMPSFACALGWVENLEKAVQLVDRFTWADWLTAANNSLQAGFDARISGYPLTEIAQESLEIAKEGLRKRGLDEECYLVRLYDRLERRKAPAEEMIDSYRSGGRDSLIQRFTYENN